MKKVLIVITTAFVEYGGLTTVVMNYLRAMPKERLSIDIASNNEADKKLLVEIGGWGSHYYNLGNRKNVFRYRERLRELLRQNDYDIIHVHGNSSTMVLELSVAKEEGVAKRIAHVHNSKAGNRFLDTLLRPFFYTSFTDGVAVSEQAGIHLFGEGKYRVLNNAINLKRYSFQPQIREQIRSEYGIKDKFVIGTVGKLNYQKNQSFLLDIFAHLCKIEEKAVLVIVGGGPLEEELKKKAKLLDIEDKTMFLGMRTDANLLIQAFDFFVFPSRFEGLGMVLIEAQASGLRCLASDSIPRETAVSSLIQYKSIEDSPQEWAKEIEKLSFDDGRQKLSYCACKSIREHGYDIVKEAEKLSELYNND